MSDKLREALIAHEKKVVDMVLSCQGDPTGVNVTSTKVLASREVFLALADSATPCIQKGCGKSNGHEGRHTDGTLPGHIATADTSPEPTEEIARKVWHEVWDTGDAPIDIRMAEEEFDTYWVALKAALPTQKKGEG